MKLNYRKIGGGRGDAYPDWLRSLKGKSGVYVIRVSSVFGGGVVYVGESHAGRLYETITRHFQTWSRNINDWHNWGRHTGHVYNRATASVAVVVTSKSKAIEKQYELIQRLRPRDNQIDGSGEVDEVPF